MAEPRAFVCGYPVRHSRSPLIHRHWLARYGIAGRYEAAEIEPANFAGFMDGLIAAGFAGGNVTIPHKEAAWRLAGRLDEAADIIGAVNTLWVEDGTIHATNTDWHGFAANLDAEAPAWDAGARKAVVLGAGGAARGVLYALIRRGFADIRVVNRTVDRSKALVDHFGQKVSAHGLPEVDELLGDASLLVNTTAAGMDGSAPLIPRLERLPDDAVVTDIVYAPLVTPLLQAARLRDLRTVDGLGMLLHQAAPGFEKWFGRAPEVTSALRDEIVADLEAHA